jgi:hypothetical protein
LHPLESAALSRRTPFLVIRLCDALLPLNHSPSDDMEDVPVLVLAEPGFARAILFGEFEDGPAAQLFRALSPGQPTLVSFRIMENGLIGYEATKGDLA